MTALMVGILRVYDDRKKLGPCVTNNFICDCVLTMVIQGKKQGEDLFRVILFENVIDAIDTIDSRPGTHIAVRNFPCPDWHHGIYMGKRNNKRTVIHVRDGKVKAVRLAEFGGHPDNQCAEIVYHEAYALPLETSMQLALDSLERHEQEDFSMKCRTKHKPNSENSTSSRST